MTVNSSHTRRKSGFTTELIDSLEVKPVLFIESMVWVMAHGGKMKRVRACSVFRGGGGADGIYGLSFPKYNDPPAYPIFFTQSPSP